MTGTEGAGFCTGTDIPEYRSDDRYQHSRSADQYGSRNRLPYDSVLPVERQGGFGSQWSGRRMDEEKGAPVQGGQLYSEPGTGHSSQSSNRSVETQEHQVLNGQYNPRQGLVRQNTGAGQANL
jgi:hypothetical protein